MTHRETLSIAWDPATKAIVHDLEPGPTGEYTFSRQGLAEFVALVVAEVRASIQPANAVELSSVIRDPKTDKIVGTVKQVLS